MITKVATVYPGHIDLPDMGQMATPANERRYGNEQLAGVFDKTDAVATRMDELGTTPPVASTTSREGTVLPNVLMSDVHMAHITRQMHWVRLQIAPCGIDAPARTSRGPDIPAEGNLRSRGRGYNARTVESRRADARAEAWSS